MIKLIREEKCLQEPWCNLILDNRGDQVLVYKRADLLFVYNFSPLKSYTDYEIMLESGKYKVVLNTDSKEYGGFGLIDEKVTHFAFKHGKVSSAAPYCIRLYLPPRVAFVLKKIPSKSVYEV